ncbi:hypothetical protein KWG64_18160 [Rahnella sp. PD12R]|uniref:hypothetical protein n=1 Tax=Rahnella sp. PD12R TaxID=2855688 RepID=UPI001C496C33|nr:hypothetical protein [Rahnella sp. PD12R]MBV6819870.1 hypothetical protein [Rahnella sp. PD12R]
MAKSRSYLTPLPAMHNMTGEINPYPAEYPVKKFKEPTKLNANSLSLSLLTQILISEICLLCSGVAFPQTSILLL